jgi:hypothetical protein
MSDPYDFNDAGSQRTLDVIPNDTICTVQMTVHAGGVGDGGWCTCAADGNSEHLNIECTVVDGQYAKRKIFTRLTVQGTTQKHAEAADITRRTIKAMLESARGIKPSDSSDVAKAARHLNGYQDLDGLRFVIRVGVRPPRDSYPAQNTIREVITPERSAWNKPESPPVMAGSAAPTASTPAAPAPQPAAAIARPNWAK